MFQNYGKAHIFLRFKFRQPPINPNTVTARIYSLQLTQCIPVQIKENHINVTNLTIHPRHMRYLPLRFFKGLCASDNYYFTNFTNL